jgi:hypothetical protein
MRAAAADDDRHRIIGQRLHRIDIPLAAFVAILLEDALIATRQRHQHGFVGGPAVGFLRRKLGQHRTVAPH